MGITSLMLSASNNKHKEDVMLTKKHSKLDYIQSQKAAYKKANRKQKSGLLNVTVVFTGYHRKYLTQLLGSNHNLLADKPQKLKVRKRHYGTDVSDAVLKIQHALAGACAELVQPALSEMAEKLEAFEHLKISNDTKTKLATISLSTVKRMLKTNKERSYTKLKLQGTTKAGDLLKAQVAVRIGFWDETEPGFFEADTVAHGGGDPNGTFIFTVNMTDVLLGWTEPFSIMSKGEKETVSAIDDVRRSLPYAIVGIDSDGGGEFINWHLKRYTERLKINFTKSRAYHSNDNAHIEQKNNVAIRWTVGYARYDTPEQLHLLNQLFRGPWRLYFNFFLRTRKVTSRSYDKLTGKTKYTFDKARTPYQRVLDHPSIPEATKAKLKSQYATLDPMKLLHEIEELQRQIRQSQSLSEKLPEHIKNPAKNNAVGEDC
jgi:hypothetical protein